MMMGNIGNKSTNLSSQMSISMDTESLIPEALVPSTLMCCMCFPMEMAIRLICVYESYHIYTEYQSLYFVFGFREKLPDWFFYMMLIIAVLNFGLIIACEYKFIRFWINPKVLENKEGLIMGMTCAIAFDIISLCFLFVLFYVVV